MNSAKDILHERFRHALGESLRALECAFPDNEELAKAVSVYAAKLMDDVRNSALGTETLAMVMVVFATCVGTMVDMAEDAATAYEN